MILCVWGCAGIGRKKAIYLMLSTRRFNHDATDRVPDNAVTKAVSMKASQIHCMFCETTPALVKEAHAAGLTVMAWFPGRMHDSAYELERLLVMGVDHICTNEPIVLKAVLDARKSKKQ